MLFSAITYCIYVCKHWITDKAIFCVCYGVFQVESDRTQDLHLLSMPVWGLWLNKVWNLTPPVTESWLDHDMIRQSAAAIASTSVCFNRIAQYCWHCFVWDESNYCYNYHLCNGCYYISTWGTTMNKTKSSQYYRQNCLQCQVTWKSAWEYSNFKTLHRWRYCSDIKVSKFHFILIS